MIEFVIPLLLGVGLGFLGGFEYAQRLMERIVEQWVDEGRIR